MLDFFINSGKLNLGSLQQGQNRVLRGGSWANNGRNLRSANRNHNWLDNRNDNTGFRLAGALLAGGSINQQAYLFRSRLFYLFGQIQGLRCVSRHIAQSLPLDRLLS